MAKHGVSLSSPRDASLPEMMQKIDVLGLFAVIWITAPTMHFNKRLD